ncbi:MAG TPA: hypothetical protein VLS89_17650 [Candidatus Nanopelagicales bacterium]|nr:hypothetical protein [Candidatus Nanopelagicales bacterium]
MRAGPLAEEPKGGEREPDARQAGLEQGAITTGELWADRWRESLRLQGRRASGGWPGTMTEARALVAAYFSAAPVGPALTCHELESAARISYARAKHHWLARE